MRAPRSTWPARRVRSPRNGHEDEDLVSGAAASGARTLHFSSVYRSVHPPSSSCTRKLSAITTAAKGATRTEPHATKSGPKDHHAGRSSAWTTGQFTQRRRQFSQRYIRRPGLLLSICPSCAWARSLCGPQGSSSRSGFARFQQRPSNGSSLMVNMFSSGEAPIGGIV